MVITAFTQGADLYAYATGERIRKATKVEQRASDEGDEYTGAFAANVSETTIKQRCPSLSIIIWGRAYSNGGT